MILISAASPYYFLLTELLILADESTTVLQIHFGFDSAAIETHNNVTRCHLVIMVITMSS